MHVSHSTELCSVTDGCSSRLWTAAAVNAILSKLGLSAKPSWNISGNPCSGAATDDTSIDDNPAFNPAIKCDCSDRNNTLCHVTRL